MIRATLALFFALCLTGTGNSYAHAQEEPLRISRPQRAQAEEKAVDACCSQQNSEEDDLLSCALPQEGLFARWQAEFINPTLCPVRLCHGSCAKSQMSCKFIKPMLDSLLDAFIPEEPPPVTVLNFRCCAGFTEDE